MIWCPLKEAVFHDRYVITFEFTLVQTITEQGDAHVVCIRSLIQRDTLLIFTCCLRAPEEVEGKRSKVSDAPESQAGWSECPCKRRKGECGAC